MVLSAMATSAITAIIFGALLFFLGMIPGLLAGLVEGLRNFWDDLSPVKRPYRDIQTDSRVFGEILLVVGGGLIMILGCVALLSR
jgi:hypothetical protein